MDIFEQVYNTVSVFSSENTLWSRPQLSAQIQITKPYKLVLTIN